MTEARPLPIHPWPLDQATTARVQEALFGRLRVPFPVEPRPAVPGSPGRILALGSLPTFVCDAALVRDPENVESIQNALRWALDATQPVENGFTVTNYLDALLGPGVVELERENIEQKVRFE